MFRSIQSWEYNIITPLDTNLFKDKVGFDIDTSVESGAQFQGNINLSKIQIDALELEVSRKSSFSSINLQTTAIRNPVLSLKNAMNRSPDLVEEMGVRDVINSNGRLLYVLASEVSASEETLLKVDDKSGVQTKFDASGINAKLKFEIIDAGKLHIKGRDGTLAPTFVRYSILQPSWKENNNPKFRAVTEANLDDFLKLVKKGKF